MVDWHGPASHGAVKDSPALSVVVPLFNEEESVALLLARIEEVLSTFTFASEIVMVDDGSTDRTWAILEELKVGRQHLRAIRLRRNYGQTSAMVAGFEYSMGEVIVTMDGDLQNDPADIPLLLEKMNEGYDIVSGWRRERQDHYSRVWPSRIANILISRSTGVALHDYGCSLKAYRADCIKSLHGYGEMHRFFPALASMTGARVTEVPVRHYPRRFGVSKYGFDRVLKVFSDIFAINLIIRFSATPLKGFLLCSAPFLFLFGGFALLACAALLLSWSPGKAGLFLIASALSGLGVLQLLALGMLGELVVSTSDLSHTHMAEITKKIMPLGGENLEQEPVPPPEGAVVTPAPEKSVAAIPLGSGP
jgi:glycosyltransferase involved in cell wall biosynthesis